MEKKLADRIKDSLANLVTLKIVTAVGQPDGKTLEPKYDEDRVMTSKIDLLQGDITNVIDEAFISGELEPLRSFHEDQVLKGEEIVRNNLEALRKLFEMAVDYDSPAEAPKETG